MKRLTRMQTVDSAFEVEGGAQRRLAGTPFPHPEVKAGPLPPLDGVDRNVPPAQMVRSMRARWALFVAVSLALHAGMLAAFQRKAPPLNSAGVRSISVDIIRADKLSALAKPSKFVSTINSAAAQGEHPVAVEPEAVHEKIKVADVASPTVPVRAPVSIEAESAIPALPQHGQPFAAAAMVETKRVEAKIAEPKSQVTQEVQPEPVEPKTARIPGHASQSIEAEPVVSALPQDGRSVAPTRMVEAVAETKRAEAEGLLTTPAHSTDTDPLVAIGPSAGTAFPSVTAPKPVAATATPAAVQSTQEVRPVHTAAPRVVMAMHPNAPTPDRIEPIATQSLPTPATTTSPATPILPPTSPNPPLAIQSVQPPSPSALTAIPSLPVPTPSRLTPFPPLPSRPAPALNPPPDAVTMPATPVRPDAGDEVLTPTSRPDPETLQASLKWRNSAGVAIEILPGAELRVGDKIALRIITKKPGYLIIMDIDATGKVTQIFPNRRSLLVAREGRQTANLIKPGRPVTVPEIGNPYAGFEFVAAPPTGIAMVVAILSDRSVQKLDPPDIPASIVGPTAAVNYLTEWTRSVRFASADAAAGPEEANWSFDAILYAIH